MLFDNKLGCLALAMQTTAMAWCVSASSFFNLKKKNKEEQEHSRKRGKKREEGRRLKITFYAV
jgi:hypothetical protein